MVQQKHCGSATLHVHNHQPEVYKRFKILFGPLRMHSEENKLANWQKHHYLVLCESNNFIYVIYVACLVYTSILTTLHLQLLRHQCRRRYRSLCLRCLRKDLAPRRRSRRRTHRTQYSHCRYFHSLRKGFEDRLSMSILIKFYGNKCICMHWLQNQRFGNNLGQCKFFNRFCVRIQVLETFSYLCKSVSTGC